MGLQDGEEVVDQADHEPYEAPEDKDKIITLDDILAGQDDQTTHIQDDDEQDYHEKFVNEIRRKDQLEQIETEKNQVNFDEDDDKFIIDIINS